jgi:hypothetical protein
MRNEEKVILHLCADLGTDSEPYRRAGYDVRCVGKDQDVRKFAPPPNVYGIIANPVCTMFSNARCNAKKDRDFKEGMELVEACLRIVWKCQYQPVSNTAKYTRLKFWMLENPYKGMLKHFLGEPPFHYSPWEYGDIYKKSTAIWGFYNIPPKTHFFHPVGMKKFDALLSHEIHPEHPHLTRTERRSVCSAKFAQAFFEANP